MYGTSAIIAPLASAPILAWSENNSKFEIIMMASGTVNKSHAKLNKSHAKLNKSDAKLSKAHSSKRKLGMSYLQHWHLCS